MEKMAEKNDDDSSHLIWGSVLASIGSLSASTWSALNSNFPDINISEVDNGKERELLEKLLEQEKKILKAQEGIHKYQVMGSCLAAASVFLLACDQYKRKYLLSKHKEKVDSPLR